MNHLFFCFLALWAGDGFDVTAEMASESLQVGKEHHFTVQIHADKAIDASFRTQTDEAWQKGLRKPILQLEVPASVKLVPIPPSGGAKKTAAEKINQSLEQPFGRLLTDKTTQIAFQLLSEPQPGDTIGINVVSYAETGNPEEATLIRHRLQMPIAAGAKATKSTVERSSWGTRDTIAIGDKAPAFDLPTGDGKRLKLTEYIGSKPIFLLTYRASW